ncbi:MAG: RNA polymerase subunit sigma-70 [Butyrivibrio sp.]|nr:RNA polymerase subunit sigma-70 [Butyrivibrio sp.]
MTETVKTQIRELRERGLSYGQISASTGIKKSTVKTFCIRTGIVVLTKLKDDELLCKCCGMPVKQDPKRKAKMFCNDKCRMTWWNRNLDKVNRKANYEYICAGCGKPFSVYGNANRKYCSHECYIKDRFGGGHDE